MPRSVVEWVGKTPDSAIPPRVKLRIWDRCIGRCAECSRKILPGMTPHFDHIQALVNGGENRESNAQLLCELCHSRKTQNDVAEKAATYRVRSKHLGIKKKKRSSFQTNRNGPFRKKLDGTVERR